MMKKMIAIALIMISIFAIALPAAHAAAADNMFATPEIRYVYTPNGNSLNVRTTPSAAGANNIIGMLDFGARVTVVGVSSGDGEWALIRYAKAEDGTAWVLAKCLAASQPSRTEGEINRQMAAYKTVDRAFTISVQPSRKGGWVNFRENPSVDVARIDILTQGHRLTVIGETLDWYHAYDSRTGRTGYICKDFVIRIS